MKLGYLIGAAISVFFILLGVGALYSQKFTQDSVSTATQGIVFQKTLNLNAYKRVSSGLGMWGSYDNYSRSDRHGDIVTVYCGSYCKD